MANLSQAEELQQKIQLFRKKAAKMSLTDTSKKSNRNNNLDIDSEKLEQWLTAPVKYQEQLRQLSNYFYHVSPIYKLVIRYMAQMPSYAFSLSPSVISKSMKDKDIREEYLRASLDIDNLNLPSELVKIALVCFKEDTYFGYEVKNSDSSFFLQLEGKYCRISSIEDGVFNFSFDFRYFDANKEALDNYPAEFKRMYEQAKKDREYWRELDSRRTICIKVNSEIFHSIPPFATMMQAILDLKDYKKINKMKAKNENFMAFIQKIPLDAKGTDINKFLIDLDLAATFHDMAEDTLPEGVGVITSPMEMEAIKTEKSKTDSDVVNNAYRESFRDAGVSEFLFNSDKNTSVGLAKSIMTDEETIFSLYRQIERWVNRRIKQRNYINEYSFKIMDFTIFSKEKFSAELLKMAQYGVPVKMELGALVGLTPNQFINKVHLENNLFQLHEILIPVASSHNQRNGGTALDKKAGRPPKSDDEISDSGMINKEKGSDVKRIEG